MKIINEKEVVVYSLVNRYIPAHYYLKVLFVFFKVSVILSVLDLCFHVCYPPSLLVRLSRCRLEACMWSAGAVPVGERAQEGWNSECPAALPAVGLGRGPKPADAES